MTPEDDEELDDQPEKQTTKSSKSATDLLQAFEARKLGQAGYRRECEVHLQACAEDELARKEYKEMKCEMPGLPRSTFLMVFSPDGTKVASTHGNHNIYVTDIRTGKNIRTLVGHPRTPWCIAFHPTSNQILASGCLGGQVRIWDLSGGSEVWTPNCPSVIASIAFHPVDRVLVIATYNEVYFWDWSKPEPFVHVTTRCTKEKVRYVAFDKLGHKLITGIANSPQSKWDRVRAPVPVPRQAERAASPYRQRITPRIIVPPPAAANHWNRSGLADVTERERRISASYRNLVREYELLVHRFMEIYRPPTMIDRGTDPMETNPSTSPQPSTSATPSTSAAAAAAAVPETDERTNEDVSDSPLRVFRLIRPTPETLIRGTQTNLPLELGTSNADETPAETPTTPATAAASVTPPPPPLPPPPENPRKRLIISPRMDSPQPSTSRLLLAACGSGTKMRIKCTQRRKSKSFPPRRLHTSTSTTDTDRNTEDNEPRPGTSGESTRRRPGLKKVCKEMVKTEVRRRLMPIINSVPPQDRPDLLRLFKHKRQHIKMQLRRMYTEGARRTTVPSSSDSSSSDGEVEATRQQSEEVVAPNTTPVVEVAEAAIPSTSQQTGSNTAETGSSSSNFNVIIEHLVTNLLSDSTSREEQSSESVGSNAASTAPPDSCARTTPPVNIRLPSNTTTTNNNDLVDNQQSLSTGTSTTNSEFSRGRVMSAFIPPRPRSRHSPRPYWLGGSPMRSRVNSALLAQDEVVNYAEWPGMEDEPLDLEAVQDLPIISPENIGIGNMYLNIVQDLESSLNDVRNIRASNRPGETSDMLSSFSERLESIMNQSDTILRNLRHSMDILTTTEGRRQLSEADGSILEDNFYVRDNSRPYTPPESATRGRVVEYSEQRAPQYVNLPQSGGYNPLTSDHTYPRNPEAASATDSMTPLMTSLHLTISHIQRQASLLREQVESIERIDRAMLEMAQVQVIRQLLVDMYRHMSNMPGTSDTSNRTNSGVSSVRHMMAGTRISDSTNTYDSSNDDQSTTTSAPPNTTPPTTTTTATTTTSSEPEPGPSTSRAADSGRVRPSRTRTARKTYPPSRFFRMQRHGRQQQLANFLGRRYLLRNERSQLRSGGVHKPFCNRFMTTRTLDFITSNASTAGLLSGETLSSMTRRLDLLLMDQTRYGLTGPENRNVPSNLEHSLRTTLNRCRARMNRVLGVEGGAASATTTSATGQEGDSITVTSDGASRYSAREALVSIIDTLTRFFSENSSLSSMTQSVQHQVQGVLGLSLLVSEILLLRIVDSIPPPSRGMHLDPERESLTARIDQMCTQMLHSRLSGQNHQLTRSLRLMRLTVQQATSALSHTYTERRASIPVPRSESRRAIVDNLYRRFQNVRDRHRRNTRQEWSRVLSDIIARFSRDNSEEGQGEESNLNAETGEQIYRARHVWVRTNQSPPSDPSSSDDNNEEENNSNNEVNSRSNSSTDPEGSIYRTSSTGLITATNPMDSPPPTTMAGPTWHVPTVQVNDVPISESSSMFHPRFWTRHRLSELRSVSTAGLFRPRFLHPLYAGVNPFEADLDDAQREHIYDNDIMITTVTPNHRIQVWDMSKGDIPVISNPLKNIVVPECKIHNDASVDIATDGTILVTLLPSGGYLNVTNRLGVYSLRWESLGQCLYITSFEQNAVSVSLSPLGRHLVVGLASRRVSIVPSEKWTLARIFVIDENATSYGSLPVLREIEQTRDSRATSYKSVNCIRWLPVSGQGLVYATNTGQLIFLT